MKQGEPVADVRVGQVWQHVEPGWGFKNHMLAEIIKTRTLHVLELVDHGAYGANEPGARCHVVETGRKVIVALRRMTPGKTRGYRMVADAP